MDVGLAVRASPERARSLLTVRAAIYSAVSSERPWSSRPSLMCSYWRSRLLLHACCGMVHLLLFLRHREPSLRSRSTPVVLPAHLRQMRLRGIRLGYRPAIERPGERTTQGGSDATVRRSGPGLGSDGVGARRAAGPPLRRGADLRDARVSDRPFRVQRWLPVLDAPPHGAGHAAQEPPPIALFRPRAARARSSRPWTIEHSTGPLNEREPAGCRNGCRERP